VVDVRPHSRRPAAEQRRDLGFGAVLVEAQHQRGPLAVGQAGQRVEQDRRLGLYAVVHQVRERGRFAAYPAVVAAAGVHDDGA
jgi:hypothetical protein